MTTRTAAGITFATALAAVLAAAVACYAPPVFAVASPDLAPGRFDARFMLAAVGCRGGNLSPALKWSHTPAGTH